MLKIGDKIRIINMEGEPLYTGREGIITYIDDMGQVHGSWGGLALHEDTDSYEILKS